MKQAKRQGKRPELTEHSLGMIPLPKGGVLTPQAAETFLAEWAGDYARVLAFSVTDCDTAAAREAYGMLGCDLAHRLNACALAVKHQAPVRFDCSQFDHDEREIDNRCTHLAVICASRSTHSHGPFEDVYDELARQIVTLLSKREAA